MILWIRSKKLKQQNGGNIIILGSSTLVRSLTDTGLINEYNVQVHPVVTNIGEHLFDGLKGRKDFEFVDVKGLEGGSFLVRYRRVETCE